MAEITTFEREGSRLSLILARLGESGLSD